MLRSLSASLARVSRRRIEISIILISTLISLSASLPTVALAQSASTTDIQASTSAKATIDPHNSEYVEARVRQYFADVPAMAAIAKCESLFRQFAPDGTVLTSSNAMIGVFQISHIHVPEALDMGMNIMTLEGNMAYARLLYDRERLDPWMSSYGCWKGATSQISTNSKIALSQKNAPVVASPMNNLSLGAVNPKVQQLQKLLNKSGYKIASAGPGSPGKETAKFGLATRAAVRRFQCAKGIVCSGNEATTGYGLVGSYTYTALLKASNV